MINLNGKWITVADEVGRRRQSNFGTVERMPEGAHEVYDFTARVAQSQKEDYDLTFRIPGSTEKYDFSYKAPVSQRLAYDFTF